MFELFLFRDICIRHNHLNQKLGSKVNKRIMNFTMFSSYDFLLISKNKNVNNKYANCYSKCSKPYCFFNLPITTKIYVLEVIELDSSQSTPFHIATNNGK